MCAYPLSLQKSAEIPVGGCHYHEIRGGAVRDLGSGFGG